MNRLSPLDELIDDITSWQVGMPVRPMEEVLRRGAAAVTPLISVVRRAWDDEERDLLWLIVLLGELRATQAIEPLADLLAHEFLQLPMAAAEALAKIGEPAVPTLVERTQTGGEDERIWAYAALGWIGGDAAYRALADALERDAELVEVAALALAEVGREEAIPVIYDALQRLEPRRRIDLENALRDLAGPPVSPPFRRDWRLRYRRLMRFGMPEPAWPVLAAGVQDREDLWRRRPPRPVRPLEEILAEGAEPADEPDLCSDCGAPREEYTGVPACPETSVGAAIVQVGMLLQARDEGFDDLFDYLDHLDSRELDLLEAGEPEDAFERNVWEDELTEAAFARRACLWLIERGVEAIGPGIDRLQQEAERLADRHGDPEGLLRGRRRGRPERQAARERDVGRNDPCPCGSGKKYKRCCGAPGGAKAARPDAAGESEDGGADGGIYDRCYDELLKFTRRPEFLDEFREGYERFAALGAAPTAGEDVGGAGPATEPSHPSIPEETAGVLVDWLLLDYRPEGGPTFLQRYLAERGRRLPERERELLRGLGTSYLGLYEVLEARPGVGLTLREVLSGATTDVSERTASGGLVRWDLIAVRLVEVEGRTELAAGTLLFPSGQRHDLVEGLEREYAGYRRDHPEASAAGFLKERGVEWLYGRAIARLRQPPPRFVTPEGHDLMFCRAHYGVSDRAAVLAALRAEPDLEEREDEPGDFAWLERPGEGDESGTTKAPEGISFESRRFEFPGAEGRRSLGHIELGHDRLRLECMSRERLERGKALLERCAGRWLSPRGETVQDPERELEEAGEHEVEARRAESALPPELEAELTSQLLERHYRSWVDEPIPALEGRTPREAVGSPEGRRRVANLVRDIENQLAREHLERGHTYEVGWLREELGLGPDE